MTFFRPSASTAHRFPVVMDGEAGRLLKNITKTAAELSPAFADSKVPQIYAERQSKTIWKLNTTGERVSSLRKQGYNIHWFERRTEGSVKTDALCAVPKNLNERLHYDLWSNGIPMILTSGTLSASGDFTKEPDEQGRRALECEHGSSSHGSAGPAKRDFRRAKETLGLDYMRTHKLFDTTMPSPFDHMNNTLLYISENVPFPDSKDKNYINAVADEIERLVTASHGHAAVLFTSYNVMGQVYALLKNRDLPFPLFRLERGGVHAIERFKRSGNGVLMASGALWEGIDIPGDTLSMLIIVKLPFAVPDPIGDYERSLCGSMETYKARAVVPDMLVKLKQGYGRLIRSETDTGICAILDCRANGRGAYRSRVLSSLPECKVTSNIQAVRDFYIDKKTTAYFFTENRR